MKDTVKGKTFLFQVDFNSPGMLIGRHNRLSLRNRRKNLKTSSRSETELRDFRPRRGPSTSKRSYPRIPAETPSVRTRDGHQGHGFKRFLGQHKQTLPAVFATQKGQNRQKRAKESVFRKGIKMRGHSLTENETSGQRAGRTMRAHEKSFQRVNRPKAQKSKGKNKGGVNKKKRVGSVTGTRLCFDGVLQI